MKFEFHTQVNMECDTSMQAFTVHKTVQKVLKLAFENAPYPIGYSISAVLLTVENPSSLIIPGGPGGEVPTA